MIKVLILGIVIDNIGFQNIIGKVIFCIVIPIGFISYYPSKIFMEGFRYGYLIPIISVVYYKLSKAIWDIGLRKYSSTGS